MSHVYVDGLCVLCGGEVKPFSPCKTPENFHRAVIVATKKVLATYGWSGPNWHTGAEYIGAHLYEALSRVKDGANQYVIGVHFDGLHETQTHYGYDYQLPGILAGILKNPKIRQIGIEVQRPEDLRLSYVISNVLYERAKEVEFTSTTPLTVTVQRIQEAIQEWHHVPAY